MGTFDDHQMGWKLKHLYIPIGDFNGITGDFGSIGAGGQIAEISDFGLCGCECADEDDIAHLMLVPYDLDVAKEVYARCFWLSDSADADASNVFELTYKFFADGATLAAPTGDGTVTWDAESQDVSSAYEIHVSNWGGMLWTTNYAAGDLFFGFKIEATVWAGTADELFLLGVEFRYTVSALDVEHRVTSR
jgi:hypothetical protein